MTPARSVPLFDQERERWRVAMGFLGGIGISALILLALAQAQRTGVDEVPEIQDLRAVMLPPPPPPPPKMAAPEHRPPPEIEVEHSPLPTPGALRVPSAPPVPAFKPAADMKFDFSPDAFHPGLEIGENDSRYIYKQSEVDQRVVVLYKKAPEISARLQREVADPRVTVLMVVNADGSVENVHLLKSAHPEFDALVIDAIEKWKFRPARKGGRNVRQWLQLPVWVKPPVPDRFTAD